MTGTIVNYPYIIWPNVDNHQRCWTQWLSDPKNRLDDCRKSCLKEPKGCLTLNSKERNQKQKCPTQKHYHHILSKFDHPSSLDRVCIVIISVDVNWSDWNAAEGLLFQMSSRELSMRKKEATVWFLKKKKPDKLFGGKGSKMRKCIQCNGQGHFRDFEEWTSDGSLHL